MPIIVYHCKKCDKNFENIYAKEADAPQTAWCYRCRARAKRVVASSNFSLKGSGFHKNDYPK